MMQSLLKLTRNYLANAAVFTYIERFLPFAMGDYQGGEPRLSALLASANLVRARHLNSYTQAFLRLCA